MKNWRRTGKNNFENVLKIELLIKQIISSDTDYTEPKKTEKIGML